MIILDWQAQKMILAKESYKTHWDRVMHWVLVVGKDNGLIYKITLEEIHQQCGSWCPDVEVGAAIVAMDRDSAHIPHKENKRA